MTRKQSADGGEAKRKKAAAQKAPQKAAPQKAPPKAAPPKAAPPKAAPPKAAPKKVVKKETPVEKPGRGRPAEKPGKGKPPGKRAKGDAQQLLPVDLPLVDVEADDTDALVNADVVLDVDGDLAIAAEAAPGGEPELSIDAAPSSNTDLEEAEAVLTDEERELRALYGEVSAPVAAHSEFQDRQTADEDRPMMPEINARDERKQRWEERRDRRRQRRDERGRQRHERQERNQQQRQQPGAPQNGSRPPQLPARVDSGPSAPPSAPSAPRPVAPQVNGQPNGHDHDALARVGTPLGDAAATVFAQLRNGQPLPVRQLAAMMRKRSLVEVDPEQLAPQLKAELLGDERSYRTLGLRPRIVYRGRDLFAPGPVAMSVTADAEAGFAAALSRLAGATHRALAQRIAKASPAGFERLIHAYLVAAGYRDIAWVKRVGSISYASATAPGIDRTVLISARSGDQPIERRGIGELRAGVEMKDLVAGILFSARELSEDAERELERAGRSIAVVCGDQLVAALIATGVGVVSAAAPLHYVDDQLLDELLAG